MEKYAQDTVKNKEEFLKIVKTQSLRWSQKYSLASFVIESQVERRQK